MNIWNKITEALSSFKISKNITEEDLLKIRQADWATCAKWWGLLNSWEWPEELLPEEKPQRVHSITNRRSLLMAAIDKKTGHKYLLRKLNVWRGDTEEQFEDFWLGTYEGDDAAYSRWKDSLRNDQRIYPKTPTNE